MSDLCEKLFNVLYSVDITDDNISYIKNLELILIIPYILLHSTGIITHDNQMLTTLHSSNVSDNEIRSVNIDECSDTNIEYFVKDTFSEKMGYFCDYFRIFRE